MVLADRAALVEPDGGVTRAGRQRDDHATLSGDDDADEGGATAG